MAVKQAHLADAYVLGTASSVNVELIKCLGVNEMIDFRMHDFSILCDIFLVIDSLGGQTLEKSWSVLRSGGHIAGLGNDSNLLIVFYVQIMPDDLVMQLHR
ncbi:hypothetical protein MMQ19_00395, partial [Klebsiella quasipneumoniae]|nr:hypothetical protein [Klebsiella quasipneumoniae]